MASSTAVSAQAHTSCAYPFGEAVDCVITISGNPAAHASHGSAVVTESRQLVVNQDYSHVR